MFEFNQYLEYLFICLLGLVFLEYFLVELIDFVFSLGFVRLVQERIKFDFFKELYIFDGIVGIECLDYRGNCFSIYFQ